MPRENKVTAAEKELRISEIFQLLIDGNTRRNILRYVKEQTDWNISESQIDYYLHDATAYLKESAKIDRDSEIGKAVERLNKLYAKSLEDKDHRTCLAIQKEITEMFALGDKKDEPIEHVITIRLDE